MKISLDDIRKMDIVFYKLGKFRKDVELFFEELNVAGYMEDEEEIAADTIKGKPVWKSGEVTAETLSGKLVIICSLEPKAYAGRLEKLGLRYGKDYIYGADLVFSMTDETPEKDIIVFGAGYHAKYRSAIFEALDVKYYIDNDCKKWGTVFNGKPVKSPESLKEEQNFLILIACVYHEEIRKQLSEMDAVDPRDVYSLEEWERHFSGYEIARLLLRTIQAPVLYGHVCPSSFEITHVQVNGDVSFCTPASRVFYSGNILKQPFDKIMNSPLSRLTRLAVVNGTYCFCNDTCSNNRFAKKLSEPIIRDEEYARTSLNIDRCNTAALNYDSACNLTCPSCRKAPIVLSEEQKRAREAIHQRVIEGLLPVTDTLFVSGNGDPFFSKYYSDLMYSKYKGENLRIQTNGQLFTEENWKKLKGKYKRLSLEISIDAATEETYRIVRRGGSFTVLMRNLELVKQLRGKDELNFLRISFVIQACNYKEMERFVDLGLHIGADIISFTPIYNWMGMPEKDYQKKNLLDETNPLHNDFLETLKKPVFKHPKVYFGFCMNGTNENVHYIPPFR